MWSFSQQRKQDQRAQVSASASAGEKGTALQSAASAKGDRFFANIMPSFTKRGGS
jgi:hypothetical protein